MTKSLCFVAIEALAALLAVAVQGIFDNGIGFGGRQDFIDFNGFAFQ